MGSYLESNVISKRARYAQTALTYYTLANTAWNTFTQAKTWFENRNNFSVRVQSDDPSYPYIHRWLLNQMPEDLQRDLVAKLDLGRASVRGETEIKDRVQLFYNSTEEQTVELNGHKIRISIESDKPDTEALMSGTAFSFKETETIVFRATSIAARNAVVDFLREIDKKMQAGNTELQLFISGSYGDWLIKPSVASRNIDSVVLKEGQKEDLLRDIQEFLESEEKYNHLGIPYHRGYLFYGPPGTGKSSLARAIATNIHANLYILSLHDLDKDTKLLDLISDVKRGSILLIEDIDTIATARDRDDEDASVSTSALLNALDGITTPHGLITIMTSNRKDVLDDALVRAGRVDKQVELDYLDAWQLNKLVEVISGRKVNLEPRSALSPSDVIEVFKSNLNDEEAAMVALKELVDG